MQKALEQMNLKLTEVLSDVTGLTGRAIIRAILRGTRAPEKLAKHRDRDKGCKASEEEIAQALTGSYREEHLFELRPTWGPGCWGRSSSSSAWAGRWSASTRRR